MDRRGSGPLHEPGAAGPGPAGSHRATAAAGAGAAHGDPVINPALRRKLSARGITLPPADELAELPLDGLLATVRDAVAGRDGWHVSEGAVLSCFSFAKEAIYRDLLDHEDLAAAHPAVRALRRRAGRAAWLRLRRDPEHEVDSRAAPETIPVMLDADASQRLAIAAALDGGRSCWTGRPARARPDDRDMIGACRFPPGRPCCSFGEGGRARRRPGPAGRAGPGAYLFAFHSHPGDTKQAAVSRAKALETPSVTPPPMPRAAVATARKRRE